MLLALSSWPFICHGFLPLCYFDMNFRLLLLVSVASWLISVSLSGQQEDISDNILWSGMQLRKAWGDGWSGQLQPIFRFNQDIGAYANSSIDYSIRRNMGKDWYVQLIGRTWFMPNRGDRQFIWTDIGKSFKIPALSLSVSNRLRWHLALDINDNFDADFLRLLVQLVPTTSWKLKPTFAVETWYQFNAANTITRLRINPGLRYRFNDEISLSTTLWIQNDINIANERRDKLWVAILTYNL